MQMVAVLLLLSLSLFPDFDSINPVFLQAGGKTVTLAFLLDIEEFDAFVAGNRMKRAGLRSKGHIFYRESVFGFFFSRER